MSDGKLLSLSPANPPDISRRPGLVFICPSAHSPFVRKDVSTLSADFDVSLIGVDSLPFPRKLVVLWSLFRKLATGNIRIVTLFFSVPTYAPLVVTLARIFGCRVAIISGGFDIANVPVIDWGEMRAGWKRMAQKYTMRLADIVLAFSDFSRADIVRFGAPRSCRTLYFGVDTQRFSPGGPKEPVAVTVCYHVNADTLIQKGILTMIDVARQVPEVSFWIVGQTSGEDAVKRAQSDAPGNVKFIDRRVDDEELVAIYRKAAIYMQVSAHEGFGIANAEAMACECIPVGTANTSLPEVIGDTGFVVAFNDVEGTATAVRQALAQPQLGEKARERIVAHFQESKRGMELRKEMQELLRI